MADAVIFRYTLFSLPFVLAAVLLETDGHAPFWKLFWIVCAAGKRTLLLGEYMNEQLLLRLPHRQFVFTLPKVLRVFFRHDKRLHGDISRLIYGLVRDFTTEAAGKPTRIAAVVVFQSSGSFCRFHPHWHGLFLEGGFDHEGRFVHVPTVDLVKMSACFRQRVIAFFLERKLLNERLARSMLDWKHSGFSVDASIHLPAGSSKTRETLVRYIVRPPVFLPHLFLDEGGVEFLVELLQHLPDSRSRLIRTYGLYSSRARGTPCPAGARARREGGPASLTWSVWLPRAGSATIHPRHPSASVHPRSRSPSCPYPPYKAAPPRGRLLFRKKRREAGPA
jgi:hypothetical protein